MTVLVVKLTGHHMGAPLYSPSRRFNRGFLPARGQPASPRDGAMWSDTPRDSFMWSDSPRDSIMWSDGYMSSPGRDTSRHSRQVLDAWPKPPAQQQGYRSYSPRPDFSPPRPSAQQHWHRSRSPEPWPHSRKSAQPHRQMSPSSGLKSSSRPSAQQHWHTPRSPEPASLSRRSAQQPSQRPRSPKPTSAARLFAQQHRHRSHSPPSSSSQALAQEHRPSAHLSSPPRQAMSSPVPSLSLPQSKSDNSRQIVRQRLPSRPAARSSQASQKFVTAMRSSKADQWKIASLPSTEPPRFGGVSSKGQTAREECSEAKTRRQDKSLSRRADEASPADCSPAGRKTNTKAAAKHKGESLSQHADEATADCRQAGRDHSPEASRKHEDGSLSRHADEALPCDRSHTGCAMSGGIKQPDTRKTASSSDLQTWLGSASDAALPAPPPRTSSDAALPAPPPRTSSVAALPGLPPRSPPTDPRKKPSAVRPLFDTEQASALLNRVLSKQIKTDKPSLDSCPDSADDTPASNSCRGSLDVRTKSGANKTNSAAETSSQRAQHGHGSCLQALQAAQHAQRDNDFSGQQHAQHSLARPAQSADEPLHSNLNQIKLPGPPAVTHSKEQNGLWAQGIENSGGLELETECWSYLDPKVTFILAHTWTIQLLNWRIGCVRSVISSAASLIVGSHMLTLACCA